MLTGYHKIALKKYANTLDVIPQEYVAKTSLITQMPLPDILSPLLSVLPQLISCSTKTPYFLLQTQNIPRWTSAMFIAHQVCVTVGVNFHVLVTSKPQGFP